jgi:hypothetical protein
MERQDLLKLAGCLEKAYQRQDLLELAGCLEKAYQALQEAMMINYDDDEISDIADGILNKEEKIMRENGFTLEEVQAAQ